MAAATATPPRNGTTPTAARPARVRRVVDLRVSRADPAAMEGDSLKDDALVRQLLPRGGDLPRLLQAAIAAGVAVRVAPADPGGRLLALVTVGHDRITLDGLGPADRSLMAEVLPALEGRFARGEDVRRLVKRALRAGVTVLVRSDLTPLD